MLTAILCGKQNYRKFVENLNFTLFHEIYSTISYVPLYYDIFSSSMNFLIKIDVSATLNKNSQQFCRPVRRFRLLPGSSPLVRSRTRRSLSSFSHSYLSVYTVPLSLSISFMQLTFSKFFDISPYGHICPIHSSRQSCAMMMMLPTCRFRCQHTQEKKRKKVL